MIWWSIRYMAFNARHSSFDDQLRSGRPGPREPKTCARAGLATRPSRLTKKCALSCTIGPPKTPPNSYLLFDGFSTVGSSANCWALKKLRDVMLVLVV
ncbi:MAG: hypothetical protein F4Z60_02360 [Chloroflexi bacterium]|nr:hypothetical protein [Chloroflexota bacterium]